MNYVLSFDNLTTLTDPQNDLEFKNVQGEVLEHWVETNEMTVMVVGYRRVPVQRIGVWVSMPDESDGNKFYPSLRWDADGKYTIVWMAMPGTGGDTNDEVPY